MTVTRHASKHLLTPLNSGALSSALSIYLIQLSTMLSTKKFLNTVEFISNARTRERPHTDEEIKEWISAYAKEKVPDYQMAAWLMAVCFKGMTPREISTLTSAMVDSGQRLEWSRRISKPLVDKHSSGGVGDKVSLILAPLVSSFGVAVPMMAGRGMGHTGGTIDKLESIPGFRTDLSIEEFQDILQRVGCVISASGPTLCPADRKIYGLRDVTSTVESLPLQTASVMCKKIATNPDSLVLDIKYGKGAFQKTFEKAEALAIGMVNTGQANGLKPTTALLTRMDNPIGKIVGNWLEVKECVDIMRGQTGGLHQDLTVLVCMHAGQMLLQSGLFGSSTYEELALKALASLKAGVAFTMFQEMVQAQGGDVSAFEGRDELRIAAVSSAVIAKQDGYIEEIDALQVGQVAVLLGAGRAVADQPIDHAAGIVFHRKAGMQVRVGDVVAVLYTNDKTVLREATNRLRKALVYSDDPVTLPPVVTHCVTTIGTQPISIPPALYCDENSPLQEAKEPTAKVKRRFSLDHFRERVLPEGSVFLMR